MILGSFNNSITFLYRFGSSKKKAVLVLMALIVITSSKIVIRVSFRYSGGISFLARMTRIPRFFFFYCCTEIQALELLVHSTLRRGVDFAFYFEFFSFLIGALVLSVLYPNA